VIPRNLRKHSPNDSFTSQNSLLLTNTAPRISNLVHLRIKALYNYKLGSRRINPLNMQNLQFQKFLSLSLPLSLSLSLSFSFSLPSPDIQSTSFPYARDCVCRQKEAVCSVVIISAFYCLLC
jgi:hypothetical protein